MKGFSQLAAGLVSDRIGRRAPMSAGLIGGATSLAAAALGAGFNGQVLIGGVAGADLKALQFGYLAGAYTPPHSQLERPGSLKHRNHPAYPTKVLMLS
jgi:MFS family permease